MIVTGKKVRSFDMEISYAEFLEAVRSPDENVFLTLLLESGLVARLTLEPTGTDEVLELGDVWKCSTDDYFKSHPGVSYENRNLTESMNWNCRQYQESRGLDIPEGILIEYDKLAGKLPVLMQTSDPSHPREIILVEPKHRGISVEITGYEPVGDISQSDVVFNRHPDLAERYAHVLPQVSIEPVQQCDALIMLVKASPEYLLKLYRGIWYRVATTVNGRTLEDLNALGFMEPHDDRICHFILNHEHHENSGPKPVDAKEFDRHRVYVDRGSHQKFPERFPAFDNLVSTK